MEFLVYLICVCWMLLPSESLSTRTLTYKDDVCYGPFNPSPDETFKAMYGGEKTGIICRDMEFYGKDSKWEACIKVELFQLETCSQRLEYRVGSSRTSHALKSYDCDDTVESIPEFCTSGILYIRVETDQKMMNSRVVYTVYAGKERESPHDLDSTDSSYLIAPLMFGGVFSVFVASLCYRKYLQKRRQEQRQEEVLYDPNYRPYVTIHHHHHYNTADHSEEQEQRTRFSQNYRDSNSPSHENNISELYRDSYSPPHENNISELYRDSYSPSHENNIFELYRDSYSPSHENNISELYRDSYSPPQENNISELYDHFEEQPDAVSSIHDLPTEQFTPPDTPEQWRANYMTDPPSYDEVMRQKT